MALPVWTSLCVSSRNGVTPRRAALCKDFPRADFPGGATWPHPVWWGLFLSDAKLKQKEGFRQEHLRCGPQTGLSRQKETLP